MLASFRSLALCVAMCALGPSTQVSGGEPDSPRSTAEELASFHLADSNLVVELVAAEPDITSPVAMAWDAAGRLFIAEMSDYPTASGGGKIKILEDRDGDGRFESARTFADGLPFPNGVLPWRDGILVTAAPDLWWLRDKNGDGQADERTVLFTGFAEGNQQLRVNGLTWGLDNWIYGANGRNDGEVRRPGSSDPPISIRRRDFRFDPTTGKFESLAGQSQFGLGRDNWGHRFLSWNTIPVRHEVFPDRYLRRQPNLTVADTIQNLLPPSDSGRVFPLTPAPLIFNKESSSHFNALAGLCVFRGDALGPPYAGNVFVGEALRNLVHRRILVPSGPTFSAERAEKNQEFLASTDPWFHPVNFAAGPDGALYIADFYRRFVEHPGYAPEIARGNVAWRIGSEHGRIWRVRRKGSTVQRRLPLNRSSGAELVEALNDPNGWRRDTAQRLLIERPDKSLIPRLTREARRGWTVLGRLHALMVLSGWRALSAGVVEQALRDPDPGIRETAVRLAEAFMTSAGQRPSLERALRALADDASDHVRFQLALTIGEMVERQQPSQDPAGARAPGPGPHSPLAATTRALARLAQRDFTNQWHGLAILSSSGRAPSELFAALFARPIPGLTPVSHDSFDFFKRLAELVAAAPSDPAWSAPWEQIGKTPAVDLPLACGFLEGCLKAHRDLTPFQPSAQWSQMIRLASETAASKNSRGWMRVAAIHLLALAKGPPASETVARLLSGNDAPEIQGAAMRAAAELNDPPLAVMIFERWNQYPLAVRRQFLPAAAGSAQLRPLVLKQLGNGRLVWGDFDPGTRASLQRGLGPAELERFGGVEPAASTNREDVIRKFMPALQLAGEGARGGAIFAQACAACHQLAGQGQPVGPDLSEVGQRAFEVLLVDILDPNRQVPPDFQSYRLVRAGGAVENGLIVSESATAVRFRQSGLPEETIPRDQILELHPEGRSLMPEGLESAWSPQDLADLLAFLRRPDN